MSGTIGVEQNSPMRTPGVAKRASVVATARSQLATSWQPAAVATPCTCAMTGCGIDCTVVISLLQVVNSSGGVVALALGQLREVMPRREGRTGPGEDDHPSRGAFEGLLQLPHQVERQRVAPLRPVERDPRDRFDVLHQEVLPRAHPVDRTPTTATCG